MYAQTATSPSSVQHHVAMPLSTSSQGIPKASSITRDRESFISGKLDLGVLDVSIDCGAGEKLDDGTRCIRFASAAMVLESLFSPTPANKAERPVPQHALPQQAVTQPPVPQMAALQKRLTLSVEAARKSEGQEVESSASEDEESVTSLRDRSLIELFENESNASSVGGIRNPGNVFITEPPTRPMMELVVIDNNSKPSVNCVVESNLDKYSPEHGLMESDRHEPIQSFREVEQVQTEVISLTEIERISSRDFKTNTNITPLNTQDIDDLIEDIDMNRTASKRRRRVSPHSSPFKRVSNMFVALKKRLQRARKDNFSESPQCGPTNQADNGPLSREPPRMRPGEETKSPNIFRKIVSIKQFSSQKTKARTERHENAHSRDSSLHVNVDRARKRHGKMFKSLEPFEYF